jgi:hypothetical protein
MTTSTLHMFSYNSVIDGFFSKSLDWEHTGERTVHARSNIRGYEDTKIRGLNINFSRDQGHIGHWHIGRLLLFIHSATTVSLTFFLVEPRAGPYWRANLCSLKDTKIQGFEDKKIRRLTINVSRGQVHIGHFRKHNFYSLFIQLQ